MPRGDRTGPAGAGPKTGRGMGNCSGSNYAGYANQAPGFRGGFGFRRGGGGRGWRNRFYATGIPGWAVANPEQDTADLQAELQTQADNLKAQLDAIQQRLNDLKSE